MAARKMSKRSKRSKRHSRRRSSRKMRGGQMTTTMGGYKPSGKTVCIYGLLNSMGQLDVYTYSSDPAFTANSSGSILTINIPASAGNLQTVCLETIQNAKQSFSNPAGNASRATELQKIQGALFSVGGKAQTGAGNYLTLYNGSTVLDAAKYSPKDGIVNNTLVSQLVIQSIDGQGRLGGNILTNGLKTKVSADTSSGPTSPVNFAFILSF
jgi:hypothetical protein